MNRTGKRRGRKSGGPKTRNKERQKMDQRTSAIEEALSRTRQGRALIDEVRRYKKEVGSYVSPRHKGE